MLLDSWLPEFDVSKRHAIRIRAPRDRVFTEVLRYDFSKSLSTRVLMGLRGYGRRSARVERGGTLPESLARFGFTPLGEDPGREMVFGLIGRFWRPKGDLCAVSGDEYPDFREPGFAKAAWNLLVEEDGPGSESDLGEE